MAGDIENLRDRIDAVDQKVDTLAGTTERRFDGVDVSIAAIERRFDDVDLKFAAVDRRFDDVDAAFAEQRQYTEFAFAQASALLTEMHAETGGQMRTGFARVDDRFNRLERKVDQFIDTQSKANALMVRLLRKR